MMMKHGKEVTIPRTKSSEILSLDHDDEAWEGGYYTEDEE